MTGNDQATENSVLTPKQDTLITALLTPLSIVASAKAAGVSEKTARRWLKLSHFQQAYKAAQRLIFDQALQELIPLVSKAVGTLERNLSGEDVPASVQVRSAQIIIDAAVTHFRASEIEQKITELEQLLKTPGRV